MRTESFAKAWHQLFNSLRDQSHRKLSFIEENILPNAQRSFLSKLEDRDRDLLESIPVSTNLLSGTQACCVRKSSEEWHICVNYGLIEVIFRYNAAFAAFLSKAPEYVVHQLIMMAALAYSSGDFKGIDVVSTAFDKVISEHITDDNLEKAFRFVDLQLQFILGHEYWHVLEPILCDSQPKFELSYFDGPTGKENEVLVPDPKSEVAADQFAGCAIGGLFTGDYQTGLHDLSIADSMLYLLDLCKILSGLPLFKTSGLPVKPSPSKELDELPITTERGAALAVCRGLIALQHNVPDETLKDSYFFAAVGRRLCNKTLDVTKKMPQSMETLETLVRWHDAKESGNWDIFFKK